MLKSKYLYACLTAGLVLGMPLSTVNSPNGLALTNGRELKVAAMNGRELNGLALTNGRELNGLALTNGRELNGISLDNRVLRAERGQLIIQVAPAQ
jgi:hypothetical protein